MFDMKLLLKKKKRTRTLHVSRCAPSQELSLILCAWTLGRISLVDQDSEQEIISMGVLTYAPTQDRQAVNKYDYLNILNMASKEIMLTTFSIQLTWQTS